MRKATRTQWIKFSIVTLLYLAFLVWVKSWLGLIVLPFIFDIYISKKIPWGFWKKSENPAVRSIMSWVCLLYTSPSPRDRTRDSGRNRRILPYAAS